MGRTGGEGTVFGGEVARASNRRASLLRRDRADESARCAGQVFSRRALDARCGRDRLRRTRGLGGWVTIACHVGNEIRRMDRTGWRGSSSDPGRGCSTSNAPPCNSSAVRSTRNTRSPMHSYPLWDESTPLPSILPRPLAWRGPSRANQPNTIVSECILRWIAIANNGKEKSRVCCGSVRLLDPPSDGICPPWQQ